MPRERAVAARRAPGARPARIPPQPCRFTGSGTGLGRGPAARGPPRRRRGGPQHAHEAAWVNAWQAAAFAGPVAAQNGAQRRVALLAGTLPNQRAWSTGRAPRRAARSAAAAECARAYACRAAAAAAAQPAGAPPESRAEQRSSRATDPHGGAPRACAAGRGGCRGGGLATATRTCGASAGAGGGECSGGDGDTSDRNDDDGGDDEDASSPADVLRTPLAALATATRTCGASGGGWLAARGGCVASRGGAPRCDRLGPARAPSSARCAGAPVPAPAAPLPAEHAFGTACARGTDRQQYGAQHTGSPVLR